MSISLVKRDRSTNATYLWRHTAPERCRVVKVVGDRAYVEWPASVRTVNYPVPLPTGHQTSVAVTGVRPAGWVDAYRLALDTEVLAGS